MLIIYLIITLFISYVRFECFTLVVLKLFVNPWTISRGVCLLKIQTNPLQSPLLSLSYSSESMLFIDAYELLNNSASNNKSMYNSENCKSKATD